MSKLSKKEWQKLTKLFCKNYSDKKLRVGQSYMNALYVVNQDLYYEITGTEADCFYDDDKVINFIRRLN